VQKWLTVPRDLSNHVARFSGWLFGRLKQLGIQGHDVEASRAVKSCSSIAIKIPMLHGV
jgi:hypothetical protein